MAVADIDIGQDGRYLLRFSYHPDTLEAIKTIPSRKWDSSVRAHYIGRHDIEIVIGIFQSLNYLVHCTPQAENSINDHINKRKNLIICKNKSASEVKPLTELKMPLRPFQVIGQNYLFNARACLLSDDMGVGKTCQMISTFKALKEQSIVKRMMVLCPSTVKGSWIKDTAKFTDLVTVVIEGTPNQRKLLYEQPYDIVILGYETYLSDFTVKETKAKDGIIKKPKVPLPLPDIQMLACDECQRLVRFKNKTTQALLLLKEKLHLGYVYPITGTPIINRIEDLWSLFCFIDPEILGEFWQFRSRYCVIEYEEIKMLDKAKRKLGIFERITKKIPKVVGYQNLKELKDKIDPYYIRREKKDVANDLPDKTYETLDIELTSGQRELYEFLKADFLNEFKSVDVTPANALVWFIRAKQICDSTEIVNPDIKESAKFNELFNLFEDLMPMDDKGNYLPGAHKVVLFSQYKEMTDILYRELERYKPLYLHGQVESQNRQLIIDSFQNDPEYRLFISTLRAGGLGITLTASDTVILYDKWFSPAANNQAIDRVHRIGQVNPVTVIDFICKDTIEERIEQILDKKKAMFEGMFGEDESVLTRLTTQELKELI